MEEMNIYQKVNKAKLAINQADIKKSGKNAFAKFGYFELSDFLPLIIQLQNEIGFYCKISFGLETATLQIIDVDKPEDFVEYVTPMSTAQLKGVNEVQNLGAVQTYLRRYLYVNAFEIVESDVLDAGQRDDRQFPAEPLLTKDMQQVMLSAVSDADGNVIPAQQEYLAGIYKSYGYTKAAEIKAKDFKAIMDKFNETALPFDV